MALRDLVLDFNADCVAAGRRDLELEVPQSLRKGW
jgi:hypothetical protein